MPSIYIQTIPIGGGVYQLMQSGRVVECKIGYDNLDFVENYKTDDRLKAAIINFGLAARYLVDDFHDWNNEIVIESDTDGKDIKFGGEHNVLFSLFNPVSGQEAQKLAGLYQDYLKYIMRAKELVRVGKIRSRLQ